MATIRERFTTLPPRDDTAQQMEQVRRLFAELADTLSHATPVSREQSAGLTKLEEAKFWFNQALIVADNDLQRAISEGENE